MEEARDDDTCSTKKVGANSALAGTPLRVKTELEEGKHDPDRSDCVTDKSGKVGTVADSVLVIVLLLTRSI